MTATETPVNNGVNVEALLGARTALTDAPEAAKFQWRATCEWQNGTHSTSKVEDFFGLGEEQKHRTKYSFDVDHPVIHAQRIVNAIWRASNLPDCGPNRVRFGKESRSWHENTRNTSPSSVTR